MVAVLPEPASPVTSTSPCCSCASVGHRVGETERVEAGDARQHPTQHEADPPALAERAHPEPAETGDPVHEVALVGGLERLDAGTGDHPGGEPFGVGGLDGVERTFAEAAVDPQARARADLHVDVRRALFHGETQQSVQVQHDASAPGIGGSPAGL